MLPFMNFGFRAIWGTLSPSNRLFLLFFGGVSLYTLWVSLRVLVELRAFKKERASSVETPKVPSVNSLRKRLANLRQLHLFSLYLLLLCIVVNIPGAFSTLGDSKSFLFSQMFENLGFLFYYYTPIFLMFVLLHSVQWVVSARVEAFEC
jgi:hypothetical protein